MTHKSQWNFIWMFTWNIYYHDWIKDNLSVCYISTEYSRWLQVNCDINPYCYYVKSQSSSFLYFEFFWILLNSLAIFIYKDELLSFILQVFVNSTPVRVIWQKFFWYPNGVSEQLGSQGWWRNSYASNIFIYS